MTSLYRHLMAGLATTTVLLLSACGGGGGGGETAVAQPTAVARPSTTTPAIGTAVVLDGSGSTTPNGGSLSYTWTLSSKPDGSAAALSDATVASPTLTPDKPGSYAVDLVVRDSKAGSTAARVTLAATNPDPVAIVSPQSQTVLQGSTVTLDGSTSLPPTGLAAADLRYEWTLTEQPSGTINTVLTDATSAKASFTASKLGVYRATLVVKHGDRVSASVLAEVSVNNGNSRPVAVTSVPTSVVRGSTVVLDGSGSTDADGDTLHYRWAFAPFVANSTNPPKPLASRPVISNATSAKAEFVPDAVGKYYLDFTVYDNSVYATQRIIVDVTKPSGVANIAPVAVIGNGSATEECEVGGYCVQSTSNSYDADGDALTGTWTYWNASTPDDKKTATGRELSALSYLTTAGTWQVQAVINDGQADSAAATQTIVIKTGANIYPIAKATVDAATVLVGDTLWFDASGSSDRNGDQLSYQWTLIDRPDNSTAELKTPTSARTSVTADQPGIYRAQLRVTDSKGAYRPDGTANFVQGFAKAKNNAPVVATLWILPNLTSDQPLVIRTYTDVTNTVRTDVPAYLTSTIFDPDLDSPLYYILTATKYPSGSSFTKSVAGQTTTGTEFQIRDSASYSGAFSLSQPGEYEFQLVASDGAAYSATRTLSVSVVTRANYPGALLEQAAATLSPTETLDASQVAWPLNSDTTVLLGLTSETDTTPRAIGTYRLYAADRDYTVAELVASSADSTVQPYFIGLQNGQVIPKGQSVTFTLVRPAIPNESAQWTALYALNASSDAYKTEFARLLKLYQDYRFTWSFRMAEQPARTFYVGPKQ